ncbi:hypothetical protein SAMN04515665_1262 [Blastococcus sp. DSM 46786]|uniref:hypothetical protein n=1 Tax=Blastococcus sp. DSM 46786 TaxID=1798227 RepID=UPI0008B65396|nr:hypothetical protein [Blastococcus sp. DSM 46786]SEM00762.1 hypothetical protein SAMN04515665_1262 [Blastococcus sp. DSM 46786]
MPSFYTAVARLLPALFAVSPGLVLLSPDFLAEPKRWIGLSGTLGGYTVIALVVRRIGRWREPGLLTRWGGYPTTSALRLTDPDADPVARERRRAALEKLYGHPLPTAEEEVAEPVRSTQRIRDAERRLRAKAAAHAGSSPLLASENRAYGFMRNTWALKPLGLVLAVAACAVACFLGVDRGWTPSLAMAAGWSAVVTVAWLTFFRPAVIHAVAKDYAERLFDVLDQLPAEQST